MRQSRRPPAEETVMSGSTAAACSGLAGLLSSRTVGSQHYRTKNYDATLVMITIITVVNKIQLCAFRIEVATYAARNACESNHVDENSALEQIKHHNREHPGYIQIE